MVSVLHCGSSGPGSCPGRGHCVVFLARGGGGGVLPYLGYTGTCRCIGYGFLASLS